MSERGFFRLALSSQSLSYLTTISSGAPMDYIKEPHCYLSNSAHPISWEEVDRAGILGITTAMKCRGARTIFSSVSSRPEFCVLGVPDDVLAHSYPLQVGSFVPYFVWAESVNRSHSSRRFAVNMINSLINDDVSFTGTLHWEPVSGIMGTLFNPNTQERESDLHI